ncbi:hypothetical protein Tco_1232955 [Tanacetum coccineum]
MTHEVLTSPTYDLIKGTCKSVVELEYHLEEVFKATNDRQKYTTSITKMKAADYGQVRWIEDKGPKRKKFYEYASNMESSHDVYFRHMIIGVTSLKIMKWFGYSHLEEIIVQRQDDQLYKFREDDFKRLRRQDIEDIRIVIQERLEDLQLGVKSYQKKIKLTKPDTHHSDLRRMTAYTAYPDIQGIIYKDEMNRINCVFYCITM